MPMQMGFRWYGEGNDKIKLSDIKQIPGVTTIVWALHHKMPGEIWEEQEIAEVMEQLHAHGFNGDVVESGLLFADPAVVDRETDELREKAIAFKLAYRQQYQQKAGWNYEPSFC